VGGGCGARKGRALTALARYHSLAPMYYRGAQAAIVVYDLTYPVRPLRGPHVYMTGTDTLRVCVCLCRKHLRVPSRG
jgi:hypothetical protein